MNSIKHIVIYLCLAALNTFYLSESRPYNRYKFIAWNNLIIGLGPKKNEMI